MSSGYSLEEDMALLRSAVSDGAALARHFFETGAQSWNKSRGEPVTEADLAVDSLLKDRLLKARPNYGWLSEETADDPARLALRRLWIVDPIDGTRSFIKQQDKWTVCGALIADSRPIAGVVMNPMTEELFEARDAGGAFCNGAPIHISERAELDGARMIGTREFYAHPSWSEPWPESLSFDNPNSLAYRLCLVARGERDAALRLFTCHEWDIAAADIIVREAGGLMTRHDGTPLTYNQPVPHQKSFIASGPRLYPELRRRMAAMQPRA